MTKVSVLLTSYNHGDYLRQSIDSILAQTFTDFELLIVDDASTDDSWDTISAYTDARITAVRNEKNTNDPVSQAVITRLRGEYVAIAHCDDFWLPDKLEKQVAFLDEHVAYGACFTKVRLVDEQGADYTDTSSWFHRSFEVENRDRHAWLNHMFFNGCPFCHPSVLMRRTLFGEPDMFAAGLCAIPDFYRWISIAMRHEIYIYPERLIAFRVRAREGNTSAETAESRRRQGQELRYALMLYKKITRPDELARVFPSAGQYLVRGEMLVPFALARVLLDEGKLPMQWLMGLDMLFELLNDPATRTQMDALYGYTYQNYYRETGKFDVFGRVPSERFQHSTLFWDTGEGFSEEHCAETKNYITERGTFYIRIATRMPPNVHALRLDPDEGSMRKYRIRAARLNGRPVRLTAKNTTEPGEWDVFYTSDPQYALDIPPDTVGDILLEVEGDTLPLPLDSVYQTAQRAAEEAARAEALEAHIKAVRGAARENRLRTAVRALLGKPVI